MKKIFFVALLLFVFGCIQQSGSKQSQPMPLNVLCAGQKTCINIERAVTPQEQETGLMFREGLDQNSGMLFVFDATQERVFWMKNTLIPLDLVWIDENKTIIGITSGVQPCISVPCNVYNSPAPVRFVLEVNSGFAAQKGLKKGDFVVFS